MKYKNLHIYSDNSNNFINFYDSVYKKDNLSFIEVDNGIVHTFKYNGENIHIGNYYGGVSDKDFNIIEESCLFWGERLACGVVERYKIDKYIDEEVIFLGLYMEHFGHHLLDGLNRMWILSQDLGIKKYCYISQIHNDLYNTFKLLGIQDENLIRVDRNIQFKKVIIPSASINFLSYYSDHSRDLFYRLGRNIESSSYKKIYLSRSAFSYQSIGTLGEKDIENIFAYNGFKVVHPEQEKLEDVISLMKGAEVVAGVSGSNMHNVVFANDNITTINLNRSDFLINAQILIDKMKNLNSYYVDSFYDIIPFKLPTGIPFVISLTKDLEQFFEDYGLSYNKEKIYDNFSENILKYLHTFSTMKDSYSIDALELSNNIQKIFEEHSLENIIYSKSVKKLDLNKNYERIINKIAWWIPMKSLRDNFRKKYLG